ncbi:MAG: hypothetical protein ACQEP7_02535 [bacterium]
MVYFALIISIFSLAMSGYFYWRFRRQQEISTDNLSNRISSLLSEFNSVSSTNIELLDDRTDELRRVIELADLKANKLNRLIDRGEGLQKSLRSAQESSPEQARYRSDREEVLSLAEEGHDLEEIVRQTGLKKGEVEVLVRMNRSRMGSQ